jgi:hypothetical protein
MIALGYIRDQITVKAYEMLNPQKVNFPGKNTFCFFNQNYDEKKNFQKRTNKLLC